MGLSNSKVNFFLKNLQFKRRILVALSWFTWLTLLVDNTSAGRLRWFRLRGGCFWLILNYNLQMVCALTICSIAFLIGQRARYFQCWGRCSLAQSLFLLARAANIESTYFLSCLDWLTLIATTAWLTLCTAPILRTACRINSLQIRILLLAGSL